MDSYQRTYPHIVKLHMLYELEESFNFLNINKCNYEDFYFFKKIIII